MAETLLAYAAGVRGSDGVEHEARARAREREDGTWEAWLEFRPVAGGATLRTARETTQPTRTDLLEWAHGISRYYLEGALARSTPGAGAAAPVAPTIRRSPSPCEPEESEGVLDPFEVAAHGRTLLRRHLDGLGVGHLRAIAHVHLVLDGDAVERLTKEQLVDAIVAETERRSVPG